MRVLQLKGKLSAKPMSTMEEVKDFLKRCEKKLGLLFDPEVSFMDYEILKGRRYVKLFTIQEAIILDLNISQAFILCDQNKVSLYKLLFDIHRERYKNTGSTIRITK